MHPDREQKLTTHFENEFGALPCSYVLSCAPGRVELAGNHTDHQGGKVISAALDRYIYGLAARNGQDAIRVWTEGHGEARIDLSEHDWGMPRECERNTSASLVRGMAALYAQAGGIVEGFDLVVCSDVPTGAGVSSSAAFEVMVGITLRELFGADAGMWESPMDVALAGMEAERAYFGKPCGAQDQIASAFGGIVAMDFACFPPQADALQFDFAHCGQTVFLIDSRCDHSAHTQEFTRIIDDMESAAKFMGASRLGDVDPQAFASRLGQAQEQLGDGACLRALHFFGETARVQRQREALEAQDIGKFLENVRLSGASSAQYLRNIDVPDASGQNQPVSIILALCAQLLGDRGAWRIHGGGFGGCVLAFVPNAQAGRFATRMNGALGYDACLVTQPGAPGAHAQLITHA